MAGEAEAVADSADPGRPLGARPATRPTTAVRSTSSGPDLRLVAPPQDGAEPAVAAAGPAEALADPAEVAGALALCVVEVMSGVRELDTIARWITDDVHRSLVRRVSIAVRARSVARRPAGRPVFRVGSAVVDRSRDDVAEAAVVVHGRSRARAVAMRLEVLDGRWQATTVGVL